MSVTAGVRPAFRRALTALLGPAIPPETTSDARPLRLGVAVSGGGDSMALLDLACGLPGVDVAAVTVDHHLRDGSGAEAQAVGRHCAARGIPHETLDWQGWTGSGNLEAEARQARYAAMSDWGRRGNVAAILLGHTRDDQAETVLMRLAREAGSDGLRGMRPAFRMATDGVLFLRPLLEIGREELRDHLRAEGIDWAEDPMNDDPRFERVRARQALAALAPLGIEARTLAAVAGNLRAENALLRDVVAQAADAVHEAAGGLRFSRAALAGMHPELRRRLLQAAIGWIAGRPYPPRREALQDFTRALLAGEARTLGGVMSTGGDMPWLLREPSALAGPVAGGANATWDGRWRIDGPWEAMAEAGPLRIGAAGEAGLRERPGWREAGLPRALALGLPAIWRGEALIAVPHLDGGPWRAHSPRDTFANSCRAH